MAMTLPFSKLYRIVISAIAISISILPFSRYFLTFNSWQSKAFHLLTVLLLLFLTKNIVKSHRLDAAIRVTLMIISVLTCTYVILDSLKFVYRAPSPNLFDIGYGVLLIIILLVATYLTTGYWLPIVCISCISLMYFGRYFPTPWTAPKYDFSRIISLIYMSEDGIFGIPLSVAIEYVILFMVWGALLDLSGAGEFFTKLVVSLLGRKGNPGIVTVLTSLVIGGPSGSGASTTSILGKICWPMLEKAGYDPNRAGGLIAATSVGAILSPPVFGATAFLLMELIHASYLEIIVWTLLPTLFYFSPLDGGI